MKQIFKQILFILLAISLIVLVGLALISLDERFISILLVLGYLSFLILSKTTRLFDKDLFIIRYEKAFFLLIAFIFAIIQTGFYNHSNLVFLFMFLTILNIGYLIFSWVYEKIKLIRELKHDSLSSELQLLKSQIDPHFFFNTLNNLYGLAIEKSDDTPQVILKLSEMMRYTIYEGKKERVSLESEIKYLENYIALHKIRHHGKLDISFEQELEDISAPIAPLLLIILLENAFKHGVENHQEQSYIKLNLKAEEDFVEFVVENNHEIIAEEDKPAPGLGLENLKRRLELIYPNKYSLEISDLAGVFSVKLFLDLS